MESRHLSLLRSLPRGEAIWLTADGMSLWPLIRPGDLLRVVRVATGELKCGHIAVARLTTAQWVAHVVIHEDPLITASLGGHVDSAVLEAVGRVDGFRRHGKEYRLPAWHRWWLRWIPVTWRAARERLVRFKK